MDVNVMDIPGMPEFLAELKTLPWFSPDGSLHDGQDGIRLFYAQSDAHTAAYQAPCANGTDFALRAACEAADDAAWERAKYEAQEAAKQAASHVAEDAARKAAFAIAMDDATAAADRINRAYSAFFRAAKTSPEAICMDAVRDAMTSAAAYAKVMCCATANLPIAAEHVEHVRKRMDVWRHGYGVYCEVDGVLYCYRRIAKK